MSENTSLADGSTRAETTTSSGPVAVGDRAPEFELRGAHEGEIGTYALSGLTDRGAVLIGSYPFDFSPVCTRQMCQLNDMDWYGYKTNLTVLGVSRDGPYSHVEFAEQEDIGFPLLSDTAGEMLAAYGLLGECDGCERVANRALLLIDEDGIVRYRWTATHNEATDVDTNPVEEAITEL